MKCVANDIGFGWLFSNRRPRFKMQALVLSQGRFSSLKKLIYLSLFLAKATHSNSLYFVSPVSKLIPKSNYSAFLGPPKQNI